MQSQNEDLNKSVRRDGLIKTSSEKKLDENKYRRVAKFLLLIGLDEAAKILSHLPQDQIEKIIPEIASIRNVEKDEAEVILAEFQAIAAKAKEKGGVDTARTILEKAYGKEKADFLLKKYVPEQEKPPFEYLNEIESEKVWILLKDESIPVRTLVVAHLEPQLAAEVINKMQGDDKTELIKRLARLKTIDPEAVRRVDKAMQEKLKTVGTDKAEKMDGRGALAEILKRMPLSAENEILASLSQSDTDLTSDLRQRLFSAEDFVNADDRFIQEYLRTMPDDEIAILIVGKNDKFRLKILSNISKIRGAQILEEEQLKLPVKKIESRAVTDKFMNDMRTAWENGNLIISGRDDEYVF
ncbi:MAG: flagellar motor switch protein FliG [Treponemataceae bacterium]|nr:flagellar motor switch protein FliG [Treponemataceae bacterium]